MKVNELALKRAREISINKITEGAKKQHEEREMSLCLNHNVCPECGGDLINEARMIHWSNILWIKRYYKAEFKRCKSCDFEINYTAWML